MVKKALIKTSKKEIKNIENDLTLKQKVFLKLYFETGNATRAALGAYDTDDYSTAAEIACQNLKKLKNPIRAYMESKGISLGALVDKMKEGLEATRTTNAAILISNSGKIEKAEEQGIIEVPDFHARHKYIETASKWLGVDKPIDEPTQPTNQQNNFYFTPDQTNRLLED